VSAQTIPAQSVGSSAWLEPIRGDGAPHAESEGVGGLRKYSAAGLTLYLGDWREHRDLLAGVDAVVTDPPYGFGYDPARSRKAVNVQRGLALVDRDWAQIEGEAEEFDPRPLIDLAPVVVLWGANHYAHRLPSSKRWFVWDKRDGVASDNQSDAEMAWCNVGGSVRLHRQLWRGIARAGEENIATAGAKLHPHQKPVALMAWCMEHAKIPVGALVADPYFGSASTAIACLRTQRRFVGFEIDQAHFDTAVARIHGELSQRDFFTGGGGGFLPLTPSPEQPRLGSNEKVSDSPPLASNNTKTANGEFAAPLG